MRQQAVLFTLTTEFWTTLSPNEQRNPVRLKGLQEAKAAAAMLTSSALDYLGLTKQFGREELVLYSAELSKQLPELFIHLSGEVREQLLLRSKTTGEAAGYQLSVTDSDSNLGDSLGLSRNITARCAHFSAIPHIVASSLLVLTTGRQFCERFTAQLPVAILPSPVSFPRLLYYQLWHARTHHSAAAMWLRDSVKSVAASLRKE